MRRLCRRIPQRGVWASPLSIDDYVDVDVEYVLLPLLVSWSGTENWPVAPPDRTFALSVTCPENVVIIVMNASAASPFHGASSLPASARKSCPPTSTLWMPRGSTVRAGAAGAGEEGAAGRFEAGTVSAGSGLDDAAASGYHRGADSTIANRFV